MRVDSGRRTTGLIETAAEVQPDPASAAGSLEHWGFLAKPDLPDRPGPAHLFVALRPRPTLQHYDPEVVEYWVTDAGRGRRAVLTHETPMPLERPFSWGLVRLIDRIGVSNEYLTFGGDLSAEAVGDTVVGVFVSPAPLLRRGGHSQGWDPAASDVGAFFARLMVAVDFQPGFEAAAAAASPVARYAAFLGDLVERHRRSPQLRAARTGIWTLLSSEDRRLRRDRPGDWASGMALLDRLHGGQAAAGV